MPSEERVCVESNGTMWMEGDRAYRHQVQARLARLMETQYFLEERVAKLEESLLRTLGRLAPRPRTNEQPDSVTIYSISNPPAASVDLPMAPTSLPRSRH